MKIKAPWRRLGKATWERLSVAVMAGPPHRHRRATAMQQAVVGRLAAGVQAVVDPGTTLPTQAPQLGLVLVETDGPEDGVQPDPAGTVSRAERLAARQTG